MHFIMNLGWREILRWTSMEAQRKEKTMNKTRESSSPTVEKSRNAHAQPTKQEIALRAYHIYLERGGAQGDALSDWVIAERQLIELAGKNGKSRRKAAAKSAGA